ncbi:PAS domain S-box protein [Sphingomonas ginkgonis]|uniref:histidine kinase n=2 Tax=Sphingomonas ginkgonis TaxID=2315330 RepID=A0A3R9Y8A3_9SPHN|nr:PAS domain S-box protein [Sphingomonas ginkgonis]
MGAPFREVWADAWDQAKPIIDAAFAGESKRFIDLPWRLATDRGLADTWWTFSYSRVLSPTGGIDGLFILTSETTAKVLGDRRRGEVEALLHRAQEAGGIGLFAVTPDGTISPTPSFCALYGLPAADTLPASAFEELVVPEDRGQVSSLAARAAGAAPLDVEYRIHRADTGALRSIARKGEIERDGDGRFVRFVGIARDVTEEAATRRALIEQQRLQAALLDLADLTRDLTDAGEIAFVSAQLLGQTLGVELAGYGDVDPEREHLTVERDWTANGAPSLVGEVRFRDFGTYIEDLKRGQAVVVTDALSDPRTAPFAQALLARAAGAFVNLPLFERGRFVALLFVSQRSHRHWTEGELDFIREVASRVRVATERARLEQARAQQARELLEMNATLEQEVARRTTDRNRLWQLSADLMLIAGFDGRIDAINPAWERTLGWDEAALVGTSLFDLIHPDDLAHTMEGARGLSEGEIYARFENRYRHRDGSYRDIVWTAGPGEGFIVAVGRDATEENQRAGALKLAEEQLRQSQKMEAVGQLTGGIAHDFNNLLQGITGSLEIIQRRVAQGRTGELDRFINGASTAANRAAALTHRLLAFSRRQPLDPRPVRANALAASMEDLLRRTIGERIELEMVLAGGLWLTHCDPNQLENAILNLVINARDAMPDGGRLSIATCNTHVDSAAAAGRQGMSPGEYVCVSVSDTGTGMDSDTIGKAFEPFFTTKPIGQGTGLGLSMIYGFAQQSEGYARIDSELGKGTTISLYLPRFRGAAEDDEAPADSGETHRADQGEVVLVVEDDSVVRGLIVEQLAELGYGAIEASDGPSGLEVLRSKRRIDLLVTDIGLPGLNGRQLADAARALRPGLRTLFMTGYAENAALASGFLEAGMEMITKPFAMDALASRIRTMIEA